MSSSLNGLVATRVSWARRRGERADIIPEMWIWRFAVWIGGTAVIFDNIGGVRA